MEWNVRHGSEEVSDSIEAVSCFMAFEEDDHEGDEIKVENNNPSYDE